MDSARGRASSSLSMVPGIYRAYEHPAEFFAPAPDEDTKKFTEMDIDQNGFGTTARVEG